MSKLLPLLILLLAACSSDFVPTEPGAGTEDGSATIGSAGGTLNAAKNGVRVELDIPAGAVMDDTDFTLRFVDGYFCHPCRS